MEELETELESLTINETKIMLNNCQKKINNLRVNKTKLMAIAGAKAAFAGLLLATPVVAGFCATNLKSLFVNKGEELTVFIDDVKNFAIIEDNITSDGKIVSTKSYDRWEEKEVISTVGEVFVTNPWESKDNSYIRNVDKYSFEASDLVTVQRLLNNPSNIKLDDYLKKVSTATESSLNITPEELANKNVFMTFTVKRLDKSDFILTKETNIENIQDILGLIFLFLCGSLLAVKLEGVLTNKLPSKVLDDNGDINADLENIKEDIAEQKGYVKLLKNKIKTNSK